MSDFGMETVGFSEFKRAIDKNPSFVANEVKKFITRALAKYRSGILNNPWRMGGNGGGSPVATGNLRDTHHSEVGNFEGRIFPTAKYSRYVHGDDGKLTNKLGRPLRPWLDWVKKDKDSDVKSLEKEMLATIVKNLAD